jgi:predicted RNA-binding Zn ribbon-like protein
VEYEDYIGNMARLVVDLVNADGPDALSPIGQLMLTDHGVPVPGAEDLAALLAGLRLAVHAVISGEALGPVNALLAAYPPQIHLSDHDGQGREHLHYAREGQPPADWLGRTCAAALAHIAAAVPRVTLGRCAATGCERFFVDDSRNRSRRYCGNACASRTTVAAYRARAAALAE